MVDDGPPDDEPPDDGPPDDEPPDDEAVIAEALDTFHRLGEELADGVEAHLPDWVSRVVHERLEQAGAVLTPTVEAATQRAGADAVTEIVPELRALLALDPDDQPTNPLAVIRRVRRYPTEVLVDAGVPPAERDPHAVAQFPDDVYDLVPASFAEIAPGLHEPGLAWGAAKAFIHLRRRR